MLHVLMYYFMVGHVITEETNNSEHFTSFSCQIFFLAFYYVSFNLSYNYHVSSYEVLNIAKSCVCLNSNISFVENGCQVKRSGDGRLESRDDTKHSQRFV